MPKFERVKRFENDNSVLLPTRATKDSAGYDFYVAEDTIIPPYEQHLRTLLRDDIDVPKSNIVDLPQLEKITKTTKAKPTLVSTGIKCKMEDNQYLELIVRSSTPLKYWLIMANANGIIDKDYYSNESNDGEIFIQLINLSPFTIELKKGDRIAQGIIHNYVTVDDDNTSAARQGGFGSTSK